MALHRRTFLHSLSATAAAWSLTRRVDMAGAGEKHIGGSRPLLKPVHQQIICPWTPHNPRHDHQLIFPLDEKRLMFVWCEYYANRPSLVSRTPDNKAGQATDHAPCRIAAKISSDQGRTWSGGIVLQENHWKQNVKHPNLIRLPSGEVLFTFVGWDNNDQRNVFQKRSKDNCETWSPRVQISKPAWYCNNADRALTLKSGRILLPAHGVIGGGGYRGRKSKLESFVYFSEDGFKTWKRSTGMTAPGRGAHEPTIVELKGGRLLCFLRNTNQRVFQSFSSDGGESWSEPQPTVLPAPESPPLLKRIPSTGDLIVIWNNVASSSNWPRTPLTVGISTDEGKTWSKFKDIDNRPNFDAAYPSISFLGNEALVAYYSRPRVGARDSEVTLKIYRTEQFYA